MSIRNPQFSIKIPDKILRNLITNLYDNKQRKQFHIQFVPMGITRKLITICIENKVKNIFKK